MKFTRAETSRKLFQRKSSVGIKAQNQWLVEGSAPAERRGKLRGVTASKILSWRDKIAA